MNTQTRLPIDRRAVHVRGCTLDTTVKGYNTPTLLSTTVARRIATSQARRRTVGDRDEGTPANPLETLLSESTNVRVMQRPAGASSASRRVRNADSDGRTADSIPLNRGGLRLQFWTPA